MIRTSVFGTILGFAIGLLAIRPAEALSIMPPIEETVTLTPVCPSMVSFMPGAYTGNFVICRGVEVKIHFDMVPPQSFTVINGSQNQACNVPDGTVVYGVVEAGNGNFVVRRVVDANNRGNLFFPIDVTNAQVICQAEPTFWGRLLGF